MSRRITIAALAVLLALAAAGYASWRVDLRWRPRAATRHAQEIAALVENAGWVSPGLSKDRAIYLVGFRSCPDCIRYETQEFPRLQAAGVDTRVILYPRRSVSDAAERAGVAELWASGDWALYQRWMATPPAAWTAEGLPPDTRPDRAALVEESRRLVERLTPLLADNGLTIAFPTLIWRDEAGRVMVCVCERPTSYAAVRKALGAS